MVNNKISACLIMKNESRKNELFKDKTNIDVCLSSLSKFVDEIIVVDTGSTDNSVEIAKKYTDKVFTFVEESFNFSNARNFSFSKATYDWILWQDMDDYYTEENINKLKKLKDEVLPNTNVKYFSWNYDYRHVGDTCIYSFVRDRLLKNDGSFKWQYAIHEELIVNGNGCVLEEITTRHTCNSDNGYKYIQMFEKRIQDGIKLKPREKYYFAGELFVLNRIDEAMEILLDFEKDNYYGTYENKRAQDYLAKGYLSKGDYKNALEHFLKCLVFDKPSVEINYNIANCYFNLDRIDEAIFWYNINAEDKYPRNNLSSTNNNCLVNSFLQLCVCYFKKGDIEKAKISNEEALKLEPTNTNAINNFNFFLNLK